MRFSGKKVFVTGVTRGIGRAIAQAFTAEGAWVIGTGTNDAPAGLDGLCHEYVRADFSDEAQLHACAEVVRRIEPDVLVNNAGINKIAPFADILPDDFR